MHHYDQPHVLYRDQSVVSVGTSDTKLLGPNPRRWAVIISSPVAFRELYTSKTVINRQVDTTTLGVKSSYVAPANTEARSVFRSVFNTAGTFGTVQLQLVRGGNTSVITSLTASGTQQGEIDLQPGDTIQWNQTVVSAAGIADFIISVMEQQAQGRITLSFQSAAVLDSGIDLYPGTQPLILLYDHVGQAIREEIRAIASLSAQTVSVLDIFEP